MRQSALTREQITDLHNKAQILGALTETTFDAYNNNSTCYLLIADFIKSIIWYIPDNVNRLHFGNSTEIPWIPDEEKYADYTLYLVGGRGVKIIRDLFSYRYIHCVDLTYFEPLNLVSTNRMFAGSNIDYIIFGELNTRNIVEMTEMFMGACIKELDLSSFDTSNVVEMYSMFQGFETENPLILKNFNTYKVYNFSEMFYKSRIPVLDISSFRSTNMKSIFNMFQNIETQKIIIPKRNFFTKNILGLNNHNIKVIEA